MNLWFVLTHPVLSVFRELASHPALVFLALALVHVYRASYWKRAATTDALTGVGNRRRADQWLAQAKGQMVAVLLDVDHFKRYNDTRGHLAGDELLRKVGRILRGHVRHGDLVARWGGEEFLLVFPGMAVGEVQAVTERLRNTIAEATGVTLSAGIAVREQEVALAMVEHADRALYQAKEVRNRQVVWKGEVA